jgi:crotonobetainyl-CoA:carnitine CoA-transferase CaiB-like acyl-CoA transferase
LPEFPLLALGFTTIKTRNFRLVPGDIQSDIVAYGTNSSNPVSSSDEYASRPDRAIAPNTPPTPNWPAHPHPGQDRRQHPCAYAPKLGQHNAEIFGRKGLSEQDIETLQAQRVV